MRNRRSRWILVLLGGLLIGFSPAIAEDDDTSDFEGNVEVLYRSINVDGSQRYYDYSFNGLDSGGRVSNLNLSWRDLDSELIDYARIDATGLGGDPYESTRLRLGRKDTYEFWLTDRSQDYFYNLFGLTGDLDGHQWQTELNGTDVGLRLFPTDKLTLTLEYNDTQRTGSSVTMKDVQRDVFLMDAPIDNNQKRYTVGFDFKMGQADLIVRQEYLNFYNDYPNMTGSNLGLDPDDSASLTAYDWQQVERTSTDLTTLKFHTPIGQRLDLTVGFVGTLLGNQEVSSRVTQNAEGTTFAMTCNLSGLPCGDDTDCDPLNFPGDRCETTPFEIVDGFSDIDTTADYQAIDVDLAVFIAEPISVLLQYRALDRDWESNGEQALGGRVCSVTGTPCSSDADCDPLNNLDVCPVPASVSTSVDYSIDTVTGIIDLRPLRNLGIEIGYRTIDRELTRNGFGILRDQPFRSDGDDTVILGVNWQATDWLKLDADYQDGEVSQPFTAVSLRETEQTRIRATMTPRGQMRIGLSYTDFENSNLGSPGQIWYGFCSDTGAVCSADANCNLGATCDIAPFDSSAEGTSWAAFISDQPNERFNYSFRYAEQEIETNAAVLADGAGFGGPGLYNPARSVYSSDNTQWMLRLSYALSTPWRFDLNIWGTESDGGNALVADDPADFSNLYVIEQEFNNLELGLRYTFPRGLYMGASYRDFDYDDANDSYDFEGGIFTVSAGFRF